MDFKGNLNEIIICCAKTLVSDMSHTSELLLPNLINTCYYEGILNLESILYYRVGFNAIRLWSTNVVMNARLIACVDISLFDAFIVL